MNHENLLKLYLSLYGRKRSSKKIVNEIDWIFSEYANEWDSFLNDFQEYSQNVTMSIYLDFMWEVIGKTGLVHKIMDVDYEILTPYGVELSNKFGSKAWKNDFKSQL